MAVMRYIVSGFETKKIQWDFLLGGGAVKKKSHLVKRLTICKKEKGFRH